VILRESKRYPGLNPLNGVEALKPRMMPRGPRSYSPGSRVQSSSYEDQGLGLRN
jgi:hypothetical protein